MFIELKFTVHVRSELITFSHDTIIETSNKRYDTISGTIFELMNPEIQNGLVLVPVNMRDNTDIIRIVYGQNINRK